MPGTILGGGGRRGLPEAQVGGERCKQAGDCKTAPGLSKEKRRRYRSSEEGYLPGTMEMAPGRLPGRGDI